MADTNRKQLELVFKTQIEGKEATVIVLDPKDGLTAAEAAAAASTIITKNVFSTKNGDLTEFVGAQIRVLTVTDLA